MSLWETQLDRAWGQGKADMWRVSSSAFEERRPGSKLIESLREWRDD